MKRSEIRKITDQMLQELFLNYGELLPYSIHFIKLPDKIPGMVTRKTIEDWKDSSYTKTEVAEIKFNVRFLSYGRNFWEGLIAHETCHLLEAKHNKEFRMAVGSLIKNKEWGKAKVPHVYLDCGWGDENEN